LIVDGFSTHGNPNERRLFDDTLDRCVARIALRQFHNEIAASTTGASRSHPTPEKFEHHDTPTKRGGSLANRDVLW
jgi:hypothetical protein